MRRLLRPILLASSVLVLACNEPAAGVDGGSDAAMESDAALPSTDSGSVADAPVPATPPALPYYEVPTTDGALAPHAWFPLPDVHYVSVAGTVTLTYDFPPELSGVIDQPLEFTGPVDAAGNATISGAVGTGTCTATGNIVRCTENFSAALMLDKANAVAMAAGYSADPAARTAIINQFASDPIGIVVFDLAVASEPSGGDRPRP